MPYKPTDEDNRLWHHIVKGAKRMAGMSSPPASPPKIITIPPPEQTRETLSPPSPISTPSLPHPPQLNRRDEARLRKGKIEIEGTIDLHGLTQEQAFGALRAFIQSSYAEKKRCVLVVTGKGRLSNPSILKQNLPHWLGAPDIAPYLLKHIPANNKHGGGGAFYIYLKRQKN